MRFRTLALGVLAAGACAAAVAWHYVGVGGSGDTGSDSPPKPEAVEAAAAAPAAEATAPAEPGVTQPVTEPRSRGPVAAADSGTAPAPADTADTADTAARTGRERPAVPAPKPNPSADAAPDVAPDLAAPDQLALAVPPDILDSPAAVPDLAPEPEPPDSEPAAITVNSFGTAATYPLKDWSVLADHAAGLIEQASVEYAGGPAGKLRDQDFLVLAGWAGDTGIGIRVNHVLFTYCGRVVGGAEVGRPRPDIADRYHPNLNTAGWQARLAVGHLPRCADGQLEAWAVNRSATTLFPLEGRIDLDLPQATDGAPKDYTARTAFRPGDGADFRSVTVTVRPGSLKIRRGPGQQFPEVRKIDRGQYQAFLTDEIDGWLQVIFNDTAGWVSGDYVEVR